MGQTIVNYGLLHSDALSQQFDAVAGLQDIFPGVVKTANLFDGAFTNSGLWVDNGDGTFSISSPPSNRRLFQDIDSKLIVGHTYEMTFEVTAYTAGDYRLEISGSTGPAQSGSGIKTRTFTVSTLGTTTGILAVGGGGAIMTVRVDNASIIDVT